MITTLPFLASSPAHTASHAATPICLHLRTVSWAPQPLGSRQVEGHQGVFHYPLPPPPPPSTLRYFCRSIVYSVFLPETENRPAGRCARCFNLTDADTTDAMKGSRCSIISWCACIYTNNTTCAWGGTSVHRALPQPLSVRMPTMLAPYASLHQECSDCGTVTPRNLRSMHIPPVRAQERFNLTTHAHTRRPENINHKVQQHYFLAPEQQYLCFDGITGRLRVHTTLQSG